MQQKISKESPLIPPPPPFVRYFACIFVVAFKHLRHHDCHHHHHLFSLIKLNSFFLALSLSLSSYYALLLTALPFILFSHFMLLVIYLFTLVVVFFVAELQSQCQSFHALTNYFNANNNKNAQKGENKLVYCFCSIISNSSYTLL